MNSTTTRLPLWEDDCEKLRKLGARFELRDVTSPDHLQFARTFAARHHLYLQKSGSVIFFNPQP